MFKHMHGGGNLKITASFADGEESVGVHPIFQVLLVFNL
jgi:hypothetical protein